MNDGLLPPDQSVDACYWVTTDQPWNPYTVTPWRWCAVFRCWRGAGGSHDPKRAWAEGYRLASPHPIPGPEELGALHDALKNLDMGVQKCAQTAYLDDDRDDDYGWMTGTHNAVTLIRAALGDKP